MGSGCSCPCNSSRNILPSNVEKRRYNKLDDLTKNEMKNSMDQHENPFTDSSTNSVRFLDTPNTNSNSNESSLHFRFEEISRGSPDFGSESSSKAQENHFFNTRTEEEDSRNGMSLKYRGSSHNTTLSCLGFDTDASHGDWRDPEDVKNVVDHRGGSDKVNYLNSPIGAKIRKNGKESDASRYKVSDVKIYHRDSNLTERKHRNENEKRSNFPAEREYCLNEPDLEIKKQQRRTSVNNVVDSQLSQVEMNMNNTSDEDKGMLLELNPNICTFHTLVSPKKIQNLKNSKQTCQRVSYVENAISKTMSERSCRKADLKEFHNTSCSPSTHRQSGSCNSGIQQFQAKVNQQKIENVNDLGEVGPRLSERRNPRNSPSKFSESVLIGEMNSGLSLSTAVSRNDFAGLQLNICKEKCGKRNLSFIDMQNPMAGIDSTREASSTKHSVEDSGVTIRKATEKYEYENADSDSTPSIDSDCSFSDLKNRFFKACERARNSSSLVDEEKAEDPGYPAVSYFAGISQPKMQISKSHNISLNCQPGPGIVEVLKKRNWPYRNLMTDGKQDCSYRARRPSCISSSKLARFQNVSVLSECKSESGANNCITKNPFVVEKEKDPYQQFNNTEDYSFTSSDQPEQNPTPEQSPPCTLSVARGREPVTSTVKPQGQSRERSNNSFDGNPGVTDTFSIPKRLETNISKWTIQEVQHWIMGLGTEVRSYKEIFKSNKIDGERLSVLTPVDLANFIPNKMHRKFFMNALRKLCPSTEDLRLDSASGCPQRYQLVRLIKIGKFSTTHVARDLQHGNRICAVKLISSEKSKKLSCPWVAAKEIAFKEWLADSSQIQDGNMIAYYYHTKDEMYRGALYNYIVVREHHPFNLELLLRNGIGLGERVSRLIFHQIVSLLCSLRLKKIGHFDLRPVNILVKSDNWHIKLTDWGSFTQFTTQSTHRDGAVDLEHLGIYAAPEIVNNWGYGLVAESWSLGVILFGLITGAVMFSSRNRGDAVYNALKDDNFKAFCRSLDDKMPWSLMTITKSMIFNLVRYNPDDRLDIMNVRDYKYYSGGLPSNKEYRSAMGRAFQPFLKHDE